VLLVGSTTCGERLLLGSRASRLQLHLLDCEEALSDDEISRNAQEQATTSCDDRKRTRSADAQDVHHPKQKKHAPAAVEEPDPANPYAPSLASVLECFRLLVEREDILQPSSDFIMEEALITTPGCGITERKRATLMRWVLEVSESFGLNHCTSGHVLSLIDRTLEKLPVRRHLALIGLACLLIGSKFLEIHPVAVDELQRCAPIYTTADILKMEKNVLETLNWDLKVVTVSEMSRCVSSQLPAGCRKRVTQLSELLIDLAQSEADPIWWLGQRRSSLALGVVLASLNICGTCFPNSSSLWTLWTRKPCRSSVASSLTSTRPTSRTEPHRHRTRWSSSSRQLSSRRSRDCGAVPVFNRCGVQCVGPIFIRKLNDD